MNWKRLEHEFTGAFFIVFGGGTIGYWVSYLTGTHDGIFTITPATAWSFCCLAFSAIAARVLFRMWTVPDEQGM